MADRPRSRMPWLIVAASVIFAALFLYVLFSAYLPAKRRAADLEAELKALYAREAQLQTQLAQQEQRSAAREQRLRALTSERDALLRRLTELERERDVKPTGPTPPRAPPGPRR